MRLNRVFRPDDLKKVEQRVAEAELFTSGEIRVAIREVCERGLSAREQALRDFHALGMHQTSDRTGVLILVVLSERKIEVVADKGINDKVSNDSWQAIVNLVTDGFKKERPVEGICKAVEEVGKLLQKHFPRKTEDIDELPDEVILEERGER